MIQTTGIVASQREIATGIWELSIEAVDVAKEAKAGQFVNLYCTDGSRLLPRPISICEAAEDKLRLVYRIAGAGTEEFSKLQAGDKIALLGPLGNGFTLCDGKALLVGGGIGIPPMLGLAKALSEKGCEVQVVLGYRDEVFLDEDFAAYGKVYYASEDGAHGVKGTVLDAIKSYELGADTIYACGPMPMLKALADYALPLEIETQLSFEERMACGIGACLACVCQSKETDEHTHVKNKRVCKDGPVFDAREVVLS